MATTLICNHQMCFMECACNWELGGTMVLIGTAGYSVVLLDNVGYCWVLGGTGWY